MKYQQLDQQVSVSDQVRGNDVPVLAQRGVQTLVCNRPDSEAADQPPFAEICEVAQAHHMRAVHIPFVAGELSQKHIDALQSCLHSGERVHAYCRTGNRSTQLWQASTGKPRPTEVNSAEPSSNPMAKQQFDVLIAGAGSGGIAVAASLLKRRANLRIAVVDSARSHYYQPGWTMVGGGVFDVETTKRPTEAVIPQGVSWIQQSLTQVVESDNKAILADGSEVYYEQLVIACGLELAWEAIEGLSDTLGQNGVTSNYRHDLAPYTWQLVKQLHRGKALFTQPPMPIKCAGAPQKALYLSADHWLRSKVLGDIEVHFHNAGQVLFGVADYVPTLNAYMDKYQVHRHFGQRLLKVDGASRTAWFECLGGDGSTRVLETGFDLLHVCPPQRAPAWVRQSPLADADGWLDVDPGTLRHQRVSNIWGLGDVTNTPNAKTLAAVRKQAPVLAQNLTDVFAGRDPSVRYDGYGSCPLTVERGKIVLAEFAYGGKLSPSFPRWLNDGTQATRLAWELKAKILPALYWRGMLKGHEWLAKPAKAQAAG